jgi:hypothetical protein
VVIDLTEMVVKMTIKVNQKVAYCHGMAEERMLGLIA